MVVYHSAFVRASVLQSFPSSVATYKKLCKYRVEFLSQDLICPVSQNNWHANNPAVLRWFWILASPFYQAIFKLV